MANWIAISPRSHGTKPDKLSTRDGICLQQGLLQART